MGLDHVREGEVLVKAELGAIEVARRRFGLNDIGGGAVFGRGDRRPQKGQQQCCDEYAHGVVSALRKALR